MSQRTAASSRANGAKSQGPATPAGRARSSQNAIHHGLSSNQVVMPGEDRAQFEDLRAGYIQRFEPADRPEMELVETMAVARWRLRRLSQIETEMLDNELALEEKRINKVFNPEVGFECRLAWVFQTMANNQKAPAMLLRYESHLTRTYERARKELEVLQITRPTPPPADQPQELQNEPSRAESGAGLTLLTRPNPGSQPPNEPTPGPQASESSPNLPPEPIRQEAA